MQHSRFQLTILTFLGLLTCAGAGWAADQPPEINFADQIQPLFKRHCVRCHGGTSPKAGLNLTTGPAILKGGETGAVIVATKPDESVLLELVESGKMPPEKEKRLSKEDVALIRRWIEAGANLIDSDAARQQLTQHDVLPILFLRCAACHGRQKQEAELDIRTVKSLLAGGKSGAAIVPGKPDESLLVKRILAGEMPPKAKLVSHSVKPVEAPELATLRDWIAQGAPEVEILPDIANGQPDPLVSDQDRQFWSFQPPRAVLPPAVAGRSDQNPIDSFVRERLVKHGLDLSPATDRLTLVRRACFDLLGLPPDPQVAQRFTGDPDPLAWEKLIDELLSSPHYGERWGQYWLDLAGYSDSEGVQNSDPTRPQVYRYRDYVIRSLNADKPYDRFLTEQLAGDELADYEHAAEITPELYDNLVATGFLRMTADGTFEGITGFVPDRLDVIDDELRVLGSAVLGMTIGCARCHSHKFDPIPQRDYYRLAAVFKAAYDEHDWLKPIRAGGATGMGDRHLPFIPADERSAWEAHEQQIQKQIDALRAALADDKDNDELKKSTDEKIKTLDAQRRVEPMIRALWDRGEPSPTYILRRGNYLTPARLVGPGILSALSDGQTPFAAQPPWPGARKTGRRLALARWLTRPDHPLTARVMVNRIWKHHFGEGLVRTLDNFGQTGEAPTHPELLDWLAVEFVRNGWSLKSMHRLMMNSAAYQQMSNVTPEREKLDPDNRLVSRFALRRLDAESVRDTLLVLSARLNRQPFGPADPIADHPDGLVTAVAGNGMYRRSIYLLQRRTLPVTLLADFDRPSMNPNCVTRSESIVAPQALHMMNNQQVHDLSQAFAERVAADAGDDPAGQIDRIHWLAYSRPATTDEREAAVRALHELQTTWLQTLPQAADGDADRERQAARRALANYCHAVMNSAALIFVD